MLVSAVHWNESAIYLCHKTVVFQWIQGQEILPGYILSLLDRHSPIPSLQVITEHWAELPVLYYTFPLAIYFACGNVYVGEGNGNPLQYSCLENPRDGGAWGAAVYGIVQSRTRLKWLSSSSSSNVYVSIPISRFIPPFSLPCFSSTYLFSIYSFPFLPCK